MLFSVMPVFEITAFADELTTGSCGENVTYSFDSTTETLTISGTGMMTDYESTTSSPFYNNSKIRKIVINEGVTSIGSYAFYRNTYINELTIPSSVTAIGFSAFSSSVLIKRSVIISSLENWCNITFADVGSNPLSGSSSTKLYLNEEIITDLVIPNGVTNIKSYAFYNYKSLTSVTIPSSVTNIANTAFEGCSKLTSIIVDSENTIYDSRDSCNGIIKTYSNTLVFGCKSTVIPESISSLGNYAFKNCTGLTNLTLSDNITSIGSNAFYGCTGLTELILPDNLISIGNNAFYGCQGLTNIVIPDSVTSLGESVFFSCSALTSVTVGNGVKSIGRLSFYNCTALANITLGTSVKTIGSSAFYNCTSLTNVIIPNSVLSIVGTAFYGCTGITKITIPESVNEIGSNAFSNCSNLEQIIITNKDCVIYDSSSTLSENAKVIGHTISSAKDYSDKYTREFSSFCDDFYAETDRVEPTYTINGYSRKICSVCGNEKIDPIVLFKEDSDATRFASNNYVLPVAKSCVYNGFLYARFDKPLASFNVFSNKFILPEMYDAETYDLFVDLIKGGTRTCYLLGGVRSGNNWINKYSQTTIDSSLLLWEDGEPNNSGGSENAISIYRDTGRLNDIDASSTGIGFLIRTNLEKTTGASETYFKTNKYVYYNEAFPYSYSKCFCEAKGGHLATIASNEENSVIYNMKPSSVLVLIGGYRNTDNEFVWINGEQFGLYTKWASGEPNNYAGTGGQYFVYMRSDGTWADCTDINIDDTFSGFICEYEPTSLSVRIDQDSTHSVADSEIHIIANYPDGTSKDITDIAEFTKTYINGYCEITASAEQPNGKTIKVTERTEVEGEHTYVQRTVTEPTCTKEGITANICSVCKARYDETIPATGHSYSFTRGVEATCTNDGYIQYTCSACGDKNRVDLPAAGHSWSDWETIVPASEEEDGTEKRGCSVCGQVEERELPAIGHSYVFNKKYNASCTTDGYDEYICSVCGKVFKDNYVKAKGHRYTPTIVEPTCTESGYTQYTCASWFCNSSYKTKYVPALGHNFENYVFNNDATSSFEGTETAKCTRCDATDTRNFANPTVYSTSTYTFAGEEISVPICITDNSGLMGFTLEFEYDSDKLTPISVETGNLIDSGLDDNLQSNAVPGKFKVVWYGTEPITDHGTLFYLKFRVGSFNAGRSSASIKFSYLQEDTFDENFEDVELNCGRVLIDIFNNNYNESSGIKGTLTSTADVVTAGDYVYLNQDINTFGDNAVQLTALRPAITYDKNAFTFLGYADCNYNRVSSGEYENTGEIVLNISQSGFYNESNPDEDLISLDFQYLLFRANDTAEQGNYEFGYELRDVQGSGIDEVRTTGCTVKVNPSAASRTSNVYIDGDVSGEYQDTVTVPVRISNNKGVMGYMLNFEYNPDELEIVLAKRGNAFSGSFNDTIGIDDDGSFSVLWSGNDAVATDGVLMNLTFRVLTDEFVISPITITYSQDDTFNNNYEDIFFNCISGSIHLNEEDNHVFVDSVVTPTPNSKGYTKHTCINCGYSYTDSETDYANDMSALSAALKKVKSFDSEDYLASTYNQLQKVYNNYLDYPNMSIPQTTIDSATSEILTAVSNLVPYLNLKVVSEHGSVAVNNVENESNYKFTFGKSVTLTAVADEGYVFDGWYETVSKRIRSKDETFTFKITSNTSFEARFVKAQSATLTFMNDSGWIAGTVTKTIAEWNEVTSINDLLPSVPYKLGYTNGRWVYDNSTVLQALQSGNDVIVTPVYYETNYENPLIPTPIGNEPALDLYYQLDSDKNVGSFTMAAGIPENCQVESIGIAFYYRKAAEFNPSEFELNINNKLLTSKFDASDEDGIYTVDINGFTSYYNWSARGYVTYYDKDGNLKLAYSNQINIVDRQQIV